MSETTEQRPGTIGWIDLTVPDAERVRDFYAGVVGWRPEPVDMGGYRDFNMVPPATGRPAAGVCHARGSNADLPACWIVYITVEDVERSAARAVELGGKIRRPPSGSAEFGRFCVVEDPAGAVAALFQPGTKT